MSKCQNVGRFITIRTRNMNAGKLYAIRALKHPAKYPYSTLSRSTSMASCVSVVRWIPSVSHVKMSKCGTLYHDSDQKYMNAGKLYAIRALKHPAKYPYSTLSRSTSMASCVSVVKWIPSVSYVKMSKCGTLYRDSDQNMNAGKLYAIRALKHLAKYAYSTDRKSVV